MESQPQKTLDQVRAKPSQPVPTVLSRAEVQSVLHEIIYTHVLNRGPKAVRSPLDEQK